MKLSVCITINERSEDTLRQVFNSLRGQDYDELVIVLDMPPKPIADFCKDYWSASDKTRFVEIARAPGWRSPVKAWNAGYARVTGTHLYCFSSETVQQPDNLKKAHTMLADEPAVYFGKAECSCGPEGTEVNWNGTAPGNLLCDAAHPRPLGFIWAAPMKQVREINGWDENFYHGFWFDEADFFLRLWRTGLPFIFDDSISGTHLHHPRTTLDAPAGQQGIQRNAAYIQQKWGTVDPLSVIGKLINRQPGRTVWTHP